MKFITSFVQQVVIREIPRPFGRWKIEHGIAIHHKIDFSDEDHRGCDHSVLTRNDKRILKPIVLKPNPSKKDIS
jgi:hypothetical protein